MVVVHATGSVTERLLRGKNGDGLGGNQLLTKGTYALDEEKPMTKRKKGGKRGPIRMGGPAHHRLVA